MLLKLIAFTTRALTVRGPLRVISTCSEYVPGYMKIDREELSLGKELTAAVKFWNSPAVVVPARTIIAPVGGAVREAASARLHSPLRRRKVK